MDKTHTVVYHGNCADGFGAAWVVRKRLLENGVHGKEIEFVPGVYGTSLSTGQCVNRHVTIVDFSYPKREMEVISELANKLVWIDHHKTAIENMKNYKGKAIDGVRTTQRSGAYLAWQYFFGGDSNIPQLIRHIDDRDRWEFKLHGSREIGSALFSYPFDFTLWDNIVNQGDAAIQRLILEGTALDRAHLLTVEKLIEGCAYQTKLDGFDVMAANMSYLFASDAGNIMAKENPNCAFAVTYYRRKEGKYVFSLRSVGDFDVSAIAAHYGGGGHRNAAGFEVESLMELGW